MGRLFGIALVVSSLSCAAPTDETPRAYVLSVIEMPSPTDGVLAGADLDGLDAGESASSSSAACDRRQPDYRSPNDDRGGVDGALNPLVETIDGLLEDGRTLNGGIAERIASGELLVVLEVVRGPPMRVEAFLVEPAGELALVDGRLAPDQTFVVATALGEGEGETVDGRAVVALGDLSAPLPVGVSDTDVDAEMLPVPLRSVELRFDDGDRLERGELGGMMDVEDFIDALPPSDFESYDFVRDMADVTPRADDPTRCENLSVGLAFEAIPARLERAP